MFILWKTITLHEGNLRAERAWKFDTEFFGMSCWDFCCMYAPQWKKVHLILFSEIMNQISVLEMSFSIFKWAYLIAFMHIILYPSKECLVLDRNVQKTFSSLNTTFPVSSLNEILFLHKTFSSTQQAFISDIIFQMHPYPTTLWWVILTRKIKS